MPVNSRKKLYSPSSYLLHPSKAGTNQQTDSFKHKFCTFNINNSTRSCLSVIPSGNYYARNRHFQFISFPMTAPMLTPTRLNHQIASSRFILALSASSCVLFIFKQFSLPLLACSTCRSLLSHPACQQQNKPQICQNLISRCH